ncbi:MAG TPA: hypothetical protein IGS52_09740 [Oscillatoriaceae cyanobacterium M33_DOE_052]|uniref:Uncharacterized protein n=1 Tax=Planktothricoides sp. SpSt-374 TaxID=2282167 RepID=A0A7C3VF89_9CYAN|nr:hypothetical protein [Oscillatoriaceae cyanobacterium M33_DOE_052]
MTTNFDKTLLAFLLALYQLEPALTDDELYALGEVGDALGDRSVDEDEDSTIIADIEAIAAANPALKLLYQEAMTKLAPLDGEQLYHRLPPKNLLEQQLGITSNGRGYIPQGKSNQNNTEVVNFARMVMTCDRPDKSVKKIDSLAEYWELPPTPIF